jgi:hypothetical protein
VRTRMRTPARQRVVIRRQTPEHGPQIGIRLCGVDVGDARLELVERQTAIPGMLRKLRDGPLTIGVGDAQVVDVRRFRRPLRLSVPALSIAVPARARTLLPRRLRSRPAWRSCRHPW